jgi:glutaredoxin
MTTETFVDKAAELLHRYGLLIVGVIALAVLLVDRFTPQKLFDSPEERQAFFRSVGQGETRVLVLVTEWCPACKGLEAALTGEQIPFTRIDVEESPPGAQLFMKAAQRTGSQGVPKVVVDDTVIRPSVSAVREALQPPAG